MSKDIIVYTDALKPGLATMPVFAVGDDTAWTLRFWNGTAYYAPSSVSVVIGNLGGLENISYPNAFRFTDRLNFQSVGTFSITAGVPSAITWDNEPAKVEGGRGAYLVRGRQPPGGALSDAYVRSGGVIDSLTAAPTLTVTGGGGSSATVNGAILPSYDYVRSVTVTGVGSGYTSAPSVSFSGGGGSGAAATALINGQGIVTAVVVTNGGRGYTSAPTVSFGAGAATATANVGGPISSTITTTAAGAGYTTPPSVSFSGGGGSGAAAYVTLAGGGVGNIYVTNNGTGYTSAPSVSFSGGGGAGATATSALSSILAGVEVAAPGTGYTSQPTLDPSGAATEGINVQFAGVLTNDKPFIQDYASLELQTGVNCIPQFNGQLDTSGDEVYNDALIVIRPRITSQPTFTPSGTTYSATFDPATSWVLSLLRYCQSVQLDIEIFGDSRLLYVGKLSIINKSN